MLWVGQVCSNSLDLLRLMATSKLRMIRHEPKLLETDPEQIHGLVELCLRTGNDGHMSFALHEQLGQRETESFRCSSDVDVLLQGLKEKRGLETRANFARHLEMIPPKQRHDQRNRKSRE